MYDLPYHKENNSQTIVEFIQRYPFAFIAGADPNGTPVATQVPLFYEERDGKKLLSGHFMRNTDHHHVFTLNENVLAVFTGHHTYVSGTWYSNPSTPSTWNYMSIHAKGRIRFTDETELKHLIQKTSLFFENYNESSTTVYENLPENFRKWAIKAIVGFEIEVQKIDTVFKLSQDRDYDSYCNIINKLKDQGESGIVIALEMEKRISLLFPGKTLTNV